MSIIFHHYKKILSKSSVICFDNNSSPSAGYGINDYNYNNNLTTILKQELEKWYNFSFVLRKQNRELFEQMLQSSSNKYSNAIDTKGENYSMESLINLSNKLTVISEG